MARKDEVLPIKRFDRPTFLEYYWYCDPGEHVTIVAPTGQGKTYLANQLLERSASPEVPAVVLVMKPKDATTRKFSKEHRYRTVKNWPPAPSIWQPRKPPGFALWPRHSYDPRIDNPAHADIFRRAILDSYKKGNRIVFADELYSLDNELGLGEDLVTVWTKGRSMRTSLWGATQRPAHVPLHAYSNAVHLFLSYDPDKRSRDRFREIAGVDPDLISSGIDQLEPYEWLYIHRRGRSSTLCIVGA